MKSRKVLFQLVAFVSSLLAGKLAAQTVEQVLLIKGASYVQTSAAAPVIDPSPPGANYTTPPNNGGPYSFNIEISGSNLAGLNPVPKVTLPAGSTYPTQNPTRHNGGNLGYSTADQTWGYGVDSNNYSAPTAAERDASFAFGTYGFTVNGTSFNLNFSNTTFRENTPTVTLTGGTWVRGVYMINVTQALTITTNVFTNFDQNADAAMELSVDGVSNQLVFHSDNPTADKFLTATIPANTLVAGREYSADAGFFAIVDRSTAIAGSLTVAAYGATTQFKILAYSGTLPSATMHGIGDLPGGFVYSEVRDVARVGGLLFAVGNSTARAPFDGAGDTAVVWSSTGDLRALPNLVVNNTAISFVTAAAITPDGAYIASRARSDGTNGRQAVRVATNGLTNVSFAGLVGGTTFSAANAISNDGSILYGFANNGNQAVRYTVSGPTGTVIPFLNPGDSSNTPAPRGTSADGSVMVGSSVNSTTAHFGAFRYVHGTGVSAIPYLPGGTLNQALAVSPDGNLVLVNGNSSSAPQGEFYLYNATTQAITALGTPNGGLGTNGVAGMTSDGSVVAVGMSDSTVYRSYIRNANGWHSFQSVAAAAGASLSGWTLDRVNGMSSDGTLVWGSGLHNGNREGFVVDIAAGFLANYNEPATFSFPGQAILGAWTTGDTTSANGGGAVLIFYANGYYVHIEIPGPGEPPSGVAGFERGQYTWDANTGLLKTWTLLDTNGDVGLSGNDGGPGIPVSVTGNTATATTDEGQVTLTRVTGTSPLVGAFGAANVSDASASFVFLPNGYFYFVQDGDSRPGTGNPNGRDGIEWGTYTWNPGTHSFATNVLVDTNGQWGMSNPQGAQSLTISDDLQMFNLADSSTIWAVNRTSGNPAITSHPASQAIVLGDPVTFAVTATGTPAPTYQWRKNGVNIPGATSSSYFIPSVGLGDAGNYSVAVSNVLVSHLATLSVQYAPLFTSQPVTHHVTVGANVTLSVTTDAAPAATYQWKKDGVDIPGATSASYTITNAQLGDTASYTAVATNSVGATTSNAGVLTVTVAAVAPVLNDFNNDGKPDLVWRNTRTGAIAFWFMNGTAMQSATVIGSITSDWSIAGTGDFNNDGHTDLLWRKASSGAVAVWFMNGTAMQSSANLGNITADWRIDGTGDFNGDGKVDILWRKDSSGAVALWLMDGTTILSTPIIANITYDWIIGGTGDFNGDGKVDILWRKESTGAVAFWLMDGTNILSTPIVANITADWKIAGTGDYNGDGETDIIWRKESTGLVAFWLMNDTAVQSTPITATITADWVICN